MSMSMTLILIIIALGSIGIGAVMAAAFGIPEDEPEEDSPLDAEVARWQQALERTYERQGIRRTR